MLSTKYAIRFPDLQEVDVTNNKNIFEEKTITKTTKIFIETFDAFSSLTEFVIQKNKTHELEKQLNAQKEVIDTNVRNLKQQKEIELQELAKRLSERSKVEKEKMLLEIEKLRLETQQMVQNFTVSFEKQICTNKIW